MSYGQGNIIFNINPTPIPGPPFSLNSADNGLSVDPITKRIVLGNDTGGSAAGLLSSREIPTNGFPIFFLDAVSTAQIQSGLIGVLDTATNNNNISIAADNTMASLSIQTDLGTGSTPPTIQLAQIGGTSYSIDSSGNSFRVRGTSNLLRLDTANNLYELGDIDAVGNNTILQVDDTNNIIIAKATNGIRTNDPGSGTGDILMGSMVVGVVVLDATQYWEVKVNGVIKKVLVAA